MKKYLIISHKFGDVKRGSFKKSEEFSSLFPNVHLLEDVEFDSFDDIFDHNFDKYIFRTQVHGNYGCGFRPISILKRNHLVFTRYESRYAFLNNATNGFNYYKKYHKDLPNFIPFILPYSRERISDSVCIGYYSRRKNLNHSYGMFIDFLDTIDLPVNLYTMGFKTNIEHRNIKSHTHTYDKDVFFDNISHYIYPKSEICDVFPHSVCEAVFANKQIIIPEMRYRTFLDGIDDIESCIKFHRSWSDKIYDNSKCILFKDFKPFYNRLLDSDFEYRCDPTGYNNFSEWIEKEI